MNLKLFLVMKASANVIVLYRHKYCWIIWWYSTIELIETGSKRALKTLFYAIWVFTMDLFSFHFNLYASSVWINDYPNTLMYNASNIRRMAWKYQEGNNHRQCNDQKKGQTIIHKTLHSSFTSISCFRN